MQRSSLGGQAAPSHGPPPRASLTPRLSISIAIADATVTSSVDKPEEEEVEADNSHSHSHKAPSPPPPRSNTPSAALSSTVAPQHSNILHNPSTALVVKSPPQTHLSRVQSVISAHSTGQETPMEDSLTSPLGQTGLSAGDGDVEADAEAAIAVSGSGHYAPVSHTIADLLTNALGGGSGSYGYAAYHPTTAAAAAGEESRGPLSIGRKGSSTNALLPPQPTHRESILNLTNNNNNNNNNASAGVAPSSPVNIASNKLGNWMLPDGCSVVIRTCPKRDVPTTLIPLLMAENLSPVLSNTDEDDEGVFVDEGRDDEQEDGSLVDGAAGGATATMDGPETGFSSNSNKKQKDPVSRSQALMDQLSQMVSLQHSVTSHALTPEVVAISPKSSPANRAGAGGGSSTEHTLRDFFSEGFVGGTASDGALLDVFVSRMNVTLLSKSTKFVPSRTDPKHNIPRRYWRQLLALPLVIERRQPGGGGGGSRGGFTFANAANSESAGGGDAAGGGSNSSGGSGVLLVAQRSLAATRPRGDRMWLPIGLQYTVTVE